MGRKSYCALGILKASRYCPPSVFISSISLSTYSGMFTHDLLCASSQNCFLYFATSSSESPSGVNLWFFSFTPNTIVPPLVLAMAEKERQNSALGKPPAADLYFTSEFSFKTRICKTLKYSNLHLNGRNSLIVIRVWPFKMVESSLWVHFKKQARFKIKKCLLA